MNIKIFKHTTILLVLVAVSFYSCKKEEIDEPAENCTPVASGEAEILTWVLCDNGTLSISGTGAIPNYNNNNSPWNNWNDYISNVIISDGVSAIGNNAFFGCHNLTSITIPNSVTIIYNWTFSGCDMLSEINVDANNTVYSSIDGVLFSKDEKTLIMYPRAKTGHYDIPNSVATIGYYSIAYCISLTSVTIPNSVTTIDVGAFRGCTNFTSVTIPNSVIRIDTYAFFECDKLSEINVDASNTEYSSVDGVLFSKDKKTLILYPTGKTGHYDIPNSVTYIQTWAFQSCTSLASVTIPNSVATIGNYAFADCIDLTSVTIPNSVDHFGYQTFYNCISLNEIIIHAITPPYICCNDILYGIDKTKCMLYVPAGSIDAYRSARGWNEYESWSGFVNIVEIEQ